MTGGIDISTTVSIYDMNGWIQDLPSLNTGRYQHACGRYKSQTGDMVSYLFSKVLKSENISSQSTTDMNNILPIRTRANQTPILPHKHTNIFMITAYLGKHIHK